MDRGCSRLFLLALKIYSIYWRVNAKVTIHRVEREKSWSFMLMNTMEPLFLNIARIKWAKSFPLWVKSCWNSPWENGHIAPVSSRSGQQSASVMRSVHPPPPPHPSPVPLAASHPRHADAENTQTCSARHHLNWNDVPFATYYTHT